MKAVTQSSIDSDALKANLLETAEQVEIRPDLLGLLEAVEKYRGIHASLESLLYEICHPYRNWSLILPLLRSFVLKNFHHYHKLDYGPQGLQSVFQPVFRGAARFIQEPGPAAADLRGPVGLARQAGFTA